MKERRKDHEQRAKHNKDISDKYLSLMGAVISQAYSDVAEYPKRKEQWRNAGLRTSNRACSYFSSNYSKLQEEIRGSKDAINFFETDRLESFLTTYRLPLNAEYLRSRYFKIKESGVYESN